MSNREFDQFAEKYDSVLQNSIPGSLKEDVYFAQYKIATIAKLLKSEQLTIKRILDFGCGSGRSLPYIAMYFPEAELFGYDVSEASLEVATQRVPSAILFSDWKDINNNKFDLIIAANVFHHIPTELQQQTLIKCKEALTADGCLFIFEHNPYNPLTRWVFDRCPFDVDAEMISMYMLKRKAKISGLKIKKNGYTLFFPRPLAFLRPFETFIKYAPLGAQYYVQMAK